MLKLGIAEHIKPATEYVSHVRMKHVYVVRITVVSVREVAGMGVRGHPAGRGVGGV